MAGPLKGLKILDFTTLLPGPYATMMLADLGADVLRVVSGSRLDLISFLPPFIPDTSLTCGIAYLGRGKRCLALNLKDPRAGGIVRKLIVEYDIVIEQFRPGVMAKFGLDYEGLKAANPGLIYCSLTGYGQTGPLKDRAGHDINFLARSGIMSYSGRKASGPCLPGVQIADLAGGSNHAVIGILAAVIHRQATGEGQVIDVSMTDGARALNTLFAAACLVDGSEVGCEEGALNGGSLYDFYEAKDGKFIAFGGIEAQFFAAFCETIGCPELIPGGVLPEDVPRAKEAIRRAVKTKTRDEWTALFAKLDACVEPVLSLGESLNDEQARERGMVVEVDLPGGGKVRQPGHPILYSATPPAYGPAGVAEGTHTREVLLGLGYKDDQIDEFQRTGLFD